MAKRVFRPYDPGQPLPLPADLRDWLPPEHLAYLVGDLVDQLDLSPVLSVYERGDGGGNPPYHPLLLTKLLFYAYSEGVVSSRVIAAKTYTDVAFRVLACDQHPDFRTVSDFRERHLGALGELFIAVVRLADAAERARRAEAGEPKKPGRVPDPSGEPAPGAQRNFTDPDSRIMVNADKAYVQAYNAQAAVDAAPHQIILGCGVTNQAADAPHLAPMVARVEAVMGGLPGAWSADAAYFSAGNLAALGEAGIGAFIPPDPGARSAACAGNRRSRGPARRRRGRPGAAGAPARLSRAAAAHAGVGCPASARPGPPPAAPGCLTYAQLNFISDRLLGAVPS